MPDAWLDSEWAKATREEYNEKLRPLLDLPIELLLPTHGDPVLDDARTKLRAALSYFQRIDRSVQTDRRLSLRS